MSTLKTVNIQHPSSASVNAGTDTSGNFLMNSGYGSAATAYGCRAWVNFNGTGTVAINASGNVTSITDNGVGDYTVNLINSMPDIYYSAVATANTATGGASTGYSLVRSNTAPTTSAVRFVSMAGNATYGGTTDFAYCNVAIFR